MWAKLDDEFYDHPKVLAAGLEAVGMFARTLSYCARKLTDGKITFAVVQHLAQGVDGHALAEKLVAVGLWERDGDDYRIHDYLAFNPSGIRIKRQRRAAAERMQNARKRARPVRANAPRTRRERAAKFAPGSPSPVPVPVPVPKEEEKERARARETNAEPEQTGAENGTGPRGRPGLTEDTLRQMWELHRARFGGPAHTPALRQALDNLRACGHSERLIVASWWRFLDPLQNADQPQYLVPRLFAQRFALYAPDAPPQGTPIETPAERAEREKFERGAVRRAELKAAAAEYVRKRDAPLTGSVAK